MIVNVARLAQRYRGSDPRREELSVLRGRLSRAPTRYQVGEDERAAADEVAAIREAMGAVVGCGSACAGCAEGMERPEGAFPGGRCCAGPAALVFRDEEVDLLRLLGTETHHLVLPELDHSAGCVFRGATSCSLDGRHRPSICHHYLCDDLKQELNARGDAGAAGELQDRLEAAMKRYIMLRDERRLEQEFRDSFPASE